MIFQFSLTNPKSLSFPFLGPGVSGWLGDLGKGRARKQLWQAQGKGSVGDRLWEEQWKELGMFILGKRR